MQSIYDYISSKTYPGRGIYIAKAPNNDAFWCAYWIMGRSENSRNRVFEDIENSDKCGIMTRAADDSKCTDPHLIIYNPLLVERETGCVIITNGDQSDSIYDCLESADKPEHGFYDALLTREYEDDEPNWTPRISAIINQESETFDMSILKRESDDCDHCIRNFYHYEKITAGLGRLITTYIDDADPLPTFDSDPLLLKFEANNIDEFQNNVWQSLNSENKISLLVAEIGKDVKWQIINKYERVN